MPRRGHRYTAPQRENVRRGHLGQLAWNKGTGGCRNGHDPALYVATPSGVFVCLACKRANGARYRAKKQAVINFKGRLARYGLPPAAFQLLWEQQQGCCAICTASFDGKEYRIDHDHATGAVRGILCVPCNTGIGLLQDSPEVLDQAAQYLLQPPAYQLDPDEVTQREQEMTPQLSLFLQKREGLLDGGDNNYGSESTA